MKFLKILFALLTLLVLIFFGRGILTPTLTYSSEITVEKPVAEAWAVMQDESKISDWLDGITNVKHISGEKGEVGSVTEYKFDQGGQESIVLETIKSITPLEQIKMDFEAAGAMDMDYTVDYSEQGGGTVIKSTTVVTGKGLLMRSLLSFMQGSMLSQEDHNMSNLKKLINSNTTNYFPETVLEVSEKVES